MSQRKETMPRIDFSQNVELATSCVMINTYNLIDIAFCMRKYYTSVPSPSPKLKHYQDKEFFLPHSVYYYVPTFC